MQAPTWGAIGTLPKTNMLQKKNNNPIINYDFSQPLIDETILPLQVNARAHTHTRFPWRWTVPPPEFADFAAHFSADLELSSSHHQNLKPRNYLVPSATPYNECLFCCSHFWLLHHSSQAISFLYSCSLQRLHWVSQDISTAKEPLSERSLRLKFQVPNFVVFGERQSPNHSGTRRLFLSQAWRQFESKIVKCLQMQQHLRRDQD